MEELLNAMMSGAGGESGEEETGDDPLAGMLGSLLGGSGGGQASGMGGLMQAILGGGPGAGTQGSGPGAAAQGGGLEGMLGSLLGGGGSGMAANPLVAPIADALAGKLGLSQEVARMVVSFALNKLLSGILGGSAQAGGRGGAGDSRGDDQLLIQMRSGDGIDAGYLASSGMTQELVDQTGLDPETAERSLQEAFTMLGSQMEAGTGQTPPQGPDLGQGLDGLLGS